MKKAIVAVLALALFPFRLPSGDFMDEALLNAEKAWGYDVGAQILLWDMGGCIRGSSLAFVRLYGTTTIYLNRDCEWTAEPENLRLLNITLTHEIGHMLGLGHSMDPFDVMYGNERGQRRNEITPRERWVIDTGSQSLAMEGYLSSPDDLSAFFETVNKIAAKPYRSGSVQDGEAK